MGAALYAAVYLYVRWPIEHPLVEMTITPGRSVTDISEELENKKVIICSPCFRAYIGLLGCSSKLRAGDYTFESGLTAQDVVDKLLKGDFMTYRFTIPEGWTLKEIAADVKKLPFVKGDAVEETFNELGSDKTFIEELGIGWSVDNLEGYLFPSTYDVYKMQGPKNIIERMVGEFKKQFSDPIIEKSKQVDLTPAEIVTLASIIEKESSLPEERPLVASVFYNRLEKGMLIQSDPTVIYGLKDFDGNIRKKDLSDPHPYNTYVHAGLPPGPICNPGSGSIKATLNPATTDYYFFVSKNDGSHYFSKDYSEHQKAVYKYQIRREK